MTLPDPPQGWRLAVLNFYNAPEAEGYVILHRVDVQTARVRGEAWEVSGSGPTFDVALAKAIKEAEKARAVP